MDGQQNIKKISYLNNMVPRPKNLRICFQNSLDFRKPPILYFYKFNSGTLYVPQPCMKGKFKLVLQNQKIPMYPV